jgi:hypothetical protein
MRVHRLLRETTSRLELAALQKADAVVDRQHEPGPADTIELTETLDFITGWLCGRP